MAPSGGNLQPWRFVVATGELKRTVVEEMGGQAARVVQLGMKAEGFNVSVRALDEAPVVVLVFNSGFQPVPGGGSLVHEYQRLIGAQSIGAAIENLILRAYDVGLGSVWVGWVVAAQREITRVVGRSDELVAAIALGYPAESPPARPRRKLEEVVDWRWARTRRGHPSRASGSVSRPIVHGPAGVRRRRAHDPPAKAVPLATAPPRPHRV
jgi:nitroreductase